jgi:hypothetical protein
MRLRNQRAKMRFSRAEIKDHMRHHDELMRAKQSAAKQNHVAQIRALKQKNEGHERLNQQSRLVGQDESIEDIFSSPAARSKFKKQVETYDAIEYKINDDAKDRRRKYKKLQELISPSNRRKNSHKLGNDNINEKSDQQQSAKAEVVVLSPRVLLSPRTLIIPGKAQAIVKEDPSFNFDKKINTIAPVMSPRRYESKQINPSDSIFAENQQEDPSVRVETMLPSEEILIDPFKNLVQDMEVSDIDSKDIPTYCAHDWFRVLLEESAVLNGIAT